MKNAPHKPIDDYFTEIDVHTVQRERRGGLMSFLTALLVCAVECLLLTWLINGQLTIGFVVTLHIVISLVLGLYARALHKTGAENRFALLLFLMAGTTGPFGAAGLALGVLCFNLFSRRAHSFDHWYATMFPGLPQSESQRIYDDIQIGRDESSKSYSVIPFLDVLSFGNELQKRQALAKMTSNFHPNFAPAFRKALNDPSNMIRVQAATAITKIETQFLDRLIKLTAVAAVHPNDPVVVLALAEHYDAYAYTGLLDSDREQANRKKALEHYHDYLRLQPRDVDVRARIGRILLRNQQYEQAADWLRQCIDQNYFSETISEWYSEALFASGRYEQLRRFRAELPPSDVDSAMQPALKEALSLWTPGGAA